MHPGYGDDDLLLEDNQRGQIIRTGGAENKLTVRARRFQEANGTKSCQR